ncbi:Bug family tripartite tricarboxylate transporter substrate binding protein [Tropicibacter naphthalenivorans]|uniref:Argininosuccinate lyase n=1 Tax=Tropicibacter naphthalenivorans TaxID=441103 RepID=A0A0P1GJE7_9RHOB|nr:tripartite tricarboxylate transporter substrate binding protein [Tropicibacter naphthalenivorans]CUH82237.1 Argininosuccinate lyase [Tropicibacter naphthalenivorans]SMD04828.1 Tripartite-type tricarboxylate transporter, receptor component TctC [Tropicibacter naphthalenivorans]
MLNIFKKAAIAGALTLAAGAAMAQGYPEKPIEVIVGYSAGGGTDVMARTTMPFIEKYLGDGASIVVKNMPGASGQIGITEVAGSDPDGYTLGTFNLPGMMARTLDREAGYDRDSFTYLANVVNDPNVIVSAKGSGIESMDDLVAAAKEAPFAVTVGMSSLGGDDHFLLIKLQKMTETDFTIVPFKGSAPARTAVMGGHVAVGIFNVSEIAKFQGELNVLGVAQPERSDFAPEVPTFAEQGFDLVNGSMRGVVAPAGLPEDVAAKLRDAFEKAAQDPEFLEAMAATANPVSVVTGDEFRALTDGLYDLAEETWNTTPWN